MNQTNSLGTNSTQQRVYQRRNGKGNRKRNRTFTSLFTTVPVPITTTVLNSNTTFLVNSSAVPVEDFFAPVAYFIKYKYIFLLGFGLLCLFALLTVLFLIVICQCARRKTGSKKQLDGQMKKRFSDFLDNASENHEANVSLLDAHDAAIPLHNTSNANGILPNDNISATCSLDPVLVQKINQNNPPNVNSTSTPADDTSLDTLRGSLISSPSQQIPALQPSSPLAPSSSTPFSTVVTDHRNSLAKTDSTSHHEEGIAEAEKDDDLQDLDLKPLTQHFIKANNRSTGNLANHRNSSSSIPATIRGQEKKDEEEERLELHGSKTNLYEKEIRRRIGQEALNSKHTNSQVSLVSRTSEDSCY